MFKRALPYIGTFNAMVYEAVDSVLDPIVEAGSTSLKPWRRQFRGGSGVKPKNAEGLRKVSEVTPEEFRKILENIKIGRKTSVYGNYISYCFGISNSSSDDNKTLDNN